jgi:hypothetical protein
MTRRSIIWSANIYHPAAERGVRWNDPAFKIEWPMTKDGLVISEKDWQLARLEGYDNVLPECSLLTVKSAMSDGHREKRE